MNNWVILRSKLNGIDMLYPIEGSFQNMPRVGERLGIGDVFGPCATVTMVTHYVGNGFYYPGTVMRRNGIPSKFGVSLYFKTVIDVELDGDYYEPHDFDTWHGQMGWDRADWLESV